MAVSSDEKVHLDTARHTEVIQLLPGFCENIGDDIFINGPFKREFFKKPY
jgi:hypothetical protein